MAGVSGVNGVYVVVDDKGGVYFVDGTQGGRIKAATFKGERPFSVACSTSHGGASETCIISDSVGNVWRGPCRPDGRPFVPVTQTFSISEEK